MLAINAASLGRRQLKCRCDRPSSGLQRHCRTRRQNQCQSDTAATSATRGAGATSVVVVDQYTLVLVLLAVLLPPLSPGSGCCCCCCCECRQETESNHAPVMMTLYTITSDRHAPATPHARHGPFTPHVMPPSHRTSCPGYTSRPQSTCRRTLQRQEPGNVA